MNGPTSGDDVFVPLDAIIGGARWRRPGLAHADGVPRRRALDLAARARRSAARSWRRASVGAYATVREQFDTPIGRFEGIEEPLARIAGLTYLMDARAHADRRRASTPARSRRCSRRS